MIFWTAFTSSELSEVAGALAVGAGAGAGVGVGVGVGVSFFCQVGVETFGDSQLLAAETAGDFA